ncbi:MAG: hypothetical protein PVI54_08635 [Desulfobacteraceae bacterium]|jgi:hypothetical protein
MGDRSIPLGLRVHKIELGCQSSHLRVEMVVVPYNDGKNQKGIIHAQGEQ